MRSVVCGQWDKGLNGENGEEAMVNGVKIYTEKSRWKEVCEQTLERS